MNAGKLIRLAQRDGADQEAIIETVAGELASHFVEQFGVAGLVFIVEIVHRLDESDAEEVPPQTIDGGASEEGIVRRRHPVGKGVAGVDLVAPSRFLAVEETSLGHALGAGDG